MDQSTKQPSGSDWTPEQVEELRVAAEARRNSRRSFLRHGVLTTAALTTTLVLAPSEARAQGSGY